MHAIEFEVSEAEAGSRLDVLLVRRVEAMSRAEARRMAGSGEVRVNGRPCRKGHRVEAGDRVTLPRPPPRDPSPRPAAGDHPVRVVFEDDALVVLDKPAGMPCHPLRDGETGTLANVVAARWPDAVGVGRARREAGLVHRLDNDTSGLVMVARTPAAFERLRASLLSGDVRKRYTCLCEGLIGATRLIDYPIAAHPKDTSIVVACVSEREARRRSAKPAETRLTEVTHLGAVSLVEVEAPAARRHQIRVHLSVVGHPLVGDVAYGARSGLQLGRHFLHASGIELEHRGRWRSLRSELPAELAAVVAGERGA